MKISYGNRGCFVYKDDIDPIFEKKFKKDLEVTPINLYDNNYTPSFKVFRESPNKYRLPKYYVHKHLGVPQYCHGYNHININLKFNGTLNPKTKQDIAVNTCLVKLRQNGNFGNGGLLELPPGFGKTTCSLYILSQLSVKTLIIVHKEFLMNQWIERIKTFLPQASIGTLRQNKVDIEGKDIVIAMLQSLSMKEYPKDTFDSFGFTIIDETHHICSRTFSNALFKVNTRYILGLTATPQRKDGLTHVLHMFMGETLFKVERELSSKVYLEQVNFDANQYFDEIPMSANGKVSNVEIITKLVNCNERNKVIMSKIDELVLKKRNIIILTERRNHCDTLHNYCISKNYDCGLYIGGMKQKDLEVSEQKQVIIATYSLAHEGLDIPKLDSLIFATPKSDVVQASGRIMRETKGKIHDPYIVDIVDNIAPLQGMFRKRKAYYKKTGFTFVNSVSAHTETPTITLDSYAFIDE